MQRGVNIYTRLSLHSKKFVTLSPSKSRTEHLYRHSLRLVIQDSPRQSSSFTNIKMADQDRKDKYLGMSIEDRRNGYRCGNKYSVVDQIESWEKYTAGYEFSKIKIEGSASTASSDDDDQIYFPSASLNEKVSLWSGDITTLEIDAIVNAANNSLLGGGGVDGAIHRAAGGDLLAECKLLEGCETGEAKMTGGYKLPAKYVIHTVGPRGENASKLFDCYNNSLKLMLDHELRTIAFPCISTGVYGYPPFKAAHVALKTVRTFLEHNGDSVDRVIFCTFLPEDVEIYQKLLQHYFPIVKKD